MRRQFRQLRAAVEIPLLRDLPAHEPAFHLHGGLAARACALLPARRHACGGRLVPAGRARARAFEAVLLELNAARARVSCTTDAAEVVAAPELSAMCHKPTRAGAATFMGAEAGRPRSRTRSVMVDVACLAARTVGVPEATMASTLRATRLGGQLRQMVSASVCPAILDSEIAALAPTGSRAAAQRERRSSCAAQRRSCGPAT